MHKTVAIFFFVLFSIVTKAQSAFTAATGFSADIYSRNTSEQFNHIPIAFLYQDEPGSISSFLLKAAYAFPVSGATTANAYTLNPALPPSVSLQETVRPSIFTINLGMRLYLFESRNKNRLSLDLFPLGICNQSFKVKYKNYDSKNYDILNPDVNVNKTALVFAMGVDYKMALKNSSNNLEIMLHLQSPLIAGDEKYDLSYKTVAPLQLLLGYSFNTGKKKRK